MKITEIERTKKGRYSLFVDGEFLFSIHIDVLGAHHIKVGDEFTVQQLEEIRLESEFKSAKERALSLLSRSAMTKKRLYDKLAQYNDPEICQKTVQRMEEIGLINDKEYAVRFCKELAENKGYGMARIRRELILRGLEKELVEETLEAMAQKAEADPRTKITEIINQKYKNYLVDLKGRARLISVLVRLGYRYDDIRDVINRMVKDEEIYGD